MGARQSALGDKYWQLGGMIDKVLDFFDEINGNPVLFSVFIRVLLHWRRGEALPVNRADLYRKAFAAIFEQSCSTRDPIDDGGAGGGGSASALASDSRHGHHDVTAMFRRVAAHLMLRASQQQGASEDDDLFAGIRIFRPTDVKEALGKHQYKRWVALQQRSKGGLPLVRRIGAASGRRAKHDEWQFLHKSFQEALLAHALSLPAADAGDAVVAVWADTDCQCWGKKASSSAIFDRLNRTVGMPAY